ncbi:cationic amino acid transporter 2-like [Lineus longissimus]|uniref:cationic amino acid transporter 2-like n=1 Tax=Lineus longissimus TaxID=88925 RepID=UPI002B4DDF5A
MERAREFLKEQAQYYSEVFTRKKKVVPEQSKLKQCLNVFDLTSLGVGSCWGAGLYVIVGHVARKQAGPASFLSFLFAGITSFFSGMCYGEFGERVPHTTGSAYMYSYVTIGELLAFVTGWNLILEYVIGLAVNSVALSNGIDAVTGEAISQFLANHTFPVIGREYPDIVSFSLCMLVSLLVAFGVQVSVTVNNIMNAVNVGVVIFFISVGAFYAEPTNWTDNFLPFGVQGVLRGTATSFFAFIGFDVIATMGEETKNPSKTIPRSIIACLLVSLSAYVGVSIVLTLMVPYYQIARRAALVTVFKTRGVTYAQYVVLAGSITALSVDLVSAVFPVPRIIYAMSKDGLFFSPFAVINSWTKTPFRATIVVGLFSSIISMFVGLNPLVEMMSIGTLFAYTIVSASVLVLRYRPHMEDFMPPDYIGDLQDNSTTENGYIELPDINRDSDTHTPSQSDIASTMSKDDRKEKLSIDLKTKEASTEVKTKENSHLDLDRTISYGTLSETINSSTPLTKSSEESSEIQNGDPVEQNGRVHLNSPPPKDKLPLWRKILFPPVTATVETSKVVQYTVVIVFVLFFAIDAILHFAVQALIDVNAGVIFCVVILVILTAGAMIVIARQPQSRHKIGFKVPGLPWFPCIGIFLNIYLILNLSPITLARMAVWLAIGFVLYFAYGVKHAGEARWADQELVFEAHVDEDSVLTETSSAYGDASEEKTIYCRPRRDDKERNMD